MVRANSAVPEGGSLHSSGGDSFAPRQLNIGGTAWPSAKAGLRSDIDVGDGGTDDAADDADDGTTGAVVGAVPDECDPPAHAPAPEAPNETATAAMKT